MSQKLEIFNRYLNKYDRLVKANARNYISRSLVEDVAQETFLKMYLHLEYLSDDKIKNWLLMVSGNIAKNYAKKGGQYTEVLMETEHLLEFVEEFQDSAEAVFEQKNKEKAALDLLQAACDLLYERDPNWYFVMIDAKMLGMTGDEIGKVLGVNASHVAVIRSRARSFLKKKLGNRYQQLF